MTVFRNRIREITDFRLFPDFRNGDTPFERKTKIMKKEDKLSVNAKKEKEQHGYSRL